MRFRLLVAIVLTIALTAAACGADSADTTTTTEALATTQPDEPAAEEPGGGANPGSAPLTIGDETWDFDRVEFRGKPASPDTSSVTA